MPKYYAMLKHWKENGPPVYMAVAGYLGLIKPAAKRENASEEEKYGNLEELEAMFAGSGGVIQ